MSEIQYIPTLIQELTCKLTNFAPRLRKNSNQTIKQLSSRPNGLVCLKIANLGTEVVNEQVRQAGQAYILYKCFN